MGLQAPTRMATPPTMVARVEHAESRMVVNSVVYGPVPSRRLGRSLGINNIPPKVCSYSCVYCQLGNTVNMRVERQTFYEPEKISQIVKEKVKQVTDKHKQIH